MWFDDDHYSDVIMSAIASQLTGVSIVCSIVGSGTNQRKHQSWASLAFVWGIHQWPVNSPLKGLVTRKMFPFDDVIMWEGTRIVSPTMAARQYALSPPTTWIRGNGNEFFQLSKYAQWIYILMVWNVLFLMHLEVVQWFFCTRIWFRTKPTEVNRHCR